MPWFLFLARNQRQTGILDVGNLVVLVGLPKPVEPLIARSIVDRRRGDNLRARIDGVIDGSADGARRAVDLFKRRGDLFDEQYSARSAEDRVFFRYRLDFSRGFLHSLPSRLRAPAERSSAKAGGEGPFVGKGGGHL